MAHSTLPVFSHHNFPQVFDQAFTFEVRRIDRVIARSQGLIGSCCYTRCEADVEISEVETGIGYCLSHFREVNRG